jgi:hypothetical protein
MVHVDAAYFTARKGQVIAYATKQLSSCWDECLIKVLKI